jgi:hypothetical protein
MPLNIIKIGSVIVKNQLCIISLDKNNLPNISALVFISYNYEISIMYAIFIFTNLDKKESDYTV